MRELPGYRHPPKEPVAATLPEAMERARSACARSWSPSRDPECRYVISFTSDWAACGDVMSALGSMGVRDTSWAHDYPNHSVSVTCAYGVLEDVKLAVKGCRTSGTRLRLVTGS